MQHTYPKHSPKEQQELPLLPVLDAEGPDEEAEDVGVLLDALGGGLPRPVPRLRVQPDHQRVLL